MNTRAFEGLEGKKLSVMLNRQKATGEPESYVAYLKYIGEGYIILDYGKASFKTKENTIDQVIIDTGIILSVWVYKD